ncbi:MAG TPA: ergothioneine biosynthesis protein EgtB [Acidimicrobiales bacterium]|nr:ergothioneine biosynthesis protein EgtB [Acidimicrobiales bacterium]
MATTRSDGSDEPGCSDDQDTSTRLASRYSEVRALTESLAEPLSPEDQTVQSMPDVSPTKWHRGHATWFFETFLLQPGLSGYEPYHPAFAYIFNSYYETVGARHPRSERGLVSRPGTSEVADYRLHVDKAMAKLLRGSMGEDVRALVELGINHEQQHQELLLMDIKHVLSRNPLRPAYRAPGAGGSAPTLAGGSRPGPAGPGALGWYEHEGGLAEIGHRGDGFAFDNESPRHRILLAPFALADRAVTCGEWLAFMQDGGYSRPELWLSDGWSAVQQQGWHAPLYWSTEEAYSSSGSGWQIFTLAGPRPIDPSEPVCHVSYYEADAYARWTGARLPTESEWEVVAARREVRGNFLDRSSLHPRPARPAGTTLFGDVWEWTASAYSPYPAFRAAPGAVGEYNGKFMVNQYVLRGGSCVTPDDHVRASYRNFFPAGARWAFAGVRLARDPGGDR